MLRRLLTLVSCSLLLLLATAASASATTYAPTRFDDSPGSGCPADCSLRQAIAAANSGDKVQLAAGTYVVGAGELAVTKSITIAGAGARSTTVDAASSSRVFHMSSALQVTIDDLTIANGLAADSEGGGILNDSPTATTINRVAMVDNGSFGASTFADGGAVANHGTFSANRALLKHNDATTAFLNNNSATGGAIQNRAGGTLNVNNSTFSDNSVSTFDGTQVSGGGAVYVDQTAQATFVNVTFEANAANGAAQQGGSIAASNQGTVRFSNTIISDGYSPVPTTSNCSLFPGYVTSLGGNAESTNAQCIPAAPADRVVADSALGPLKNNGGPTDTHAMGSSSTVFSIGDVGNCETQPVDQRGGRRVVQGKCDPGAVQHASLAAIGMIGKLGPARYPSTRLTLLATNVGPDDAYGVAIPGTTCAWQFFVAFAHENCATAIPWDGASPLNVTLTPTGDYNVWDGGQAPESFSAPAPRLSRASLRPSKLTPAPRGSTLGAKKIRRAATITYSGLELSGFKATIEAFSKGRLVAGKCEKNKRGVKPKGAACAIWKSLGTATVKRVQSSGKLYLSGRVKNKPLKKGRYRLGLTATSSDGGVGAPRYIRFSVK